MPTITVSMRVGRSSEQKDAFAKIVTAAAVEHLDVRDAQVIIMFDEKIEGSFYRAGRQLQPAVYSQSDSQANTK